MNQPDSLRDALLDKLSDIKHYAAECTAFATASPRTVENCNTIIELADEARSALSTAAPAAQPVAWMLCCEGEPHVQPVLCLHQSEASRLAYQFHTPKIAPLYAAPTPQAEPATGIRDLRDAKWLDPQCADRGACQSLIFKAAQAPQAVPQRKHSQWVECVTQGRRSRKCRVYFAGEDAVAVQVSVARGKNEFWRNCWHRQKGAPTLTAACAIRSALIARPPMAALPTPEAPQAVPQPLNPQPDGGYPGCDCCNCPKSTCAQNAPKQP